MASPILLDITQRVTATGRIEPADVLAVRRAVYGGDGLISLNVADQVYAIEHARKAHNPEWSALFVEAMTDLVLNQQAPEGYMSSDNAAWVERQVKSRNAPSTDGDLALVVNLIERARDVPASFSAFALRLVKETVVYGDGVDARGRAHAAGRVTDADCDMLRRILWGAGSEGLLAVSRDEAEALVAIADATAGADNVAQFDDLFAKAIGNYLIAATGRMVPSREDALRWETGGRFAPKRNEPSQLMLVLSALLGVHPDHPELLNPQFYADTLRENRTLIDDVALEHANRNAARSAADAVAAVMTPEKAGWLLDRVGRNGVMTGPEKALVNFIAREAASLDPSLNDVIARVA
jgi:hypothetical protein